MFKILWILKMCQWRHGNKAKETRIKTESKTKQNKTKQKINFTVIGDFHPLGKVSHEN